MQNIKHNPIAASLRSTHLAPRRVKARKGKGSYQRRSKFGKAWA